MVTHMGAHQEMAFLHCTHPLAFFQKIKAPQSLNSAKVRMKDGREKKEAEFHQEAAKGSTSRLKWHVRGWVPRHCLQLWWNGTPQFLC